MTDKQIAWAIGIALAPLVLWLFYRGLFALYRLLPDGKVRRALFQSYWGKDAGPWAREPWQREKARERSTAVVSQRGAGSEPE
jgi:hypothetical protein